MERKHIAVTVLVVGAVINLLDAYLSGNLPFSPASSDSQNIVSKVNGFTPGLKVGSYLMAAGVLYLGYEYAEAHIL